MPDDRNGVPPGPPNPFGRARGTNGTHANGVRPTPTDLPTRPLSVDVADGPVDLVAVQADDELVNALGTGAAVTYGDGAAGAAPDLQRPRDERLVAMLAAWRAEIEAEPIPELIDLDTAVAAVAAGMNADAVGARRKRADRLRHLAPLAAAAAIIVATVSGVGLGSQGAMPGDALWPIQQVVDPERAESVEAKIAIEGRLQVVRVALAEGDTETATRELQAITAEIGEVRSEEGQPMLLQEQEFLSLKLAETPPGTPADLTTPPKSDPSVLPTSVAAVPPPPPASGPTDPSEVAVVPDEPSVSEPVDPDPRARVPSEALVPVPDTESGSEGPTVPDSGPSTPDVTEAPVEPAPDSTEGTPDEESSAPVPSGDQPVSEGGSEPASGAESGDTGSETTASGSAGTNVDATATATTS